MKKAVAMRALVAIVVLAVHDVQAVHRGSYPVAMPDALAARAAWQNATGLVWENNFDSQPVTLRVTAPAIRAGILFWRESADGMVHPHGEVWRGPVWQMVLWWQANRPGLTIVRQNVTAQSLAESPDPTSEWWGCLHMLVTNQTDLCVADYWINTVYRTYMDPVATFSHSFAAVIPSPSQPRLLCLSCLVC